MPQLDENRIKHQLSAQRSTALDNLAVAQALVEQLNEYLTKAFEALNRQVCELPEDQCNNKQTALDYQVPGYKEWKERNGTDRVPS
jgi:hypothetical protein